MTKKHLSIALFILLILCSFLGVFSSAAALISGFLFTLIFGKQYEATKAKTINYLLKASIVGLGFGMFITETLKTGKEGLSLTILTISATLILGYLLTRILKIDLKLGYLVSSGTSICGGSAIAAVSSVIKPTPKVISIALGVVFFLNAIALFVYPPIGRFLGLTQHQFGLWAAVAIHDTSSVIGAALDYGQTALQEATTVKLARTLWIIPLSILSLFLFKGKEGKVKIPWFIILFILAILINSYVDLPQVLTHGITNLSERILVATLFLIGSTISLKDLSETGIKPFILAMSLWVFISVGSLLYILNM